MSGDVVREAPRPRPLSAGIWTLFSWLRRPERSSSSESVSSVGSDRTAASFDFLAPLHYKNTNKTLVLAQDPLTETYKKRLHERNLRRQYDRDTTLRRKYGLYREEGSGYDAFSLPSTHRLRKDCGQRQDRERRATSESTQRRTAYVPGKRRAPLPPNVVAAATLPRNYKRKRPAPKPPVTIFEENKENVAINKNIQMNTTSDYDKLNKDTNTTNKTVTDSIHDSKETKLRTDKSFLKQIFDNRKRNSAIDTNRIKLLPSISELDKQAAEIIKAKKALQASEQNDINVIIDSTTSVEDTWKCTTCFRKYKPVVTCCIYCIIKESSNNKAATNMPTTSFNTYTQTDERASNSSRKSENDEKKKLREMLKEMKDSLPKRPKHNHSSRLIQPLETPTLRIGTTVEETSKANLNDNDPIKLNTKAGSNKLKNAKELFLTSQPSSSKDSHTKLVTTNIENNNRKTHMKSSQSTLDTAVNSLNSSFTISKDLNQQYEKKTLDKNKNSLILRNVESPSVKSEILKQTKHSTQQIASKILESTHQLNKIKVENIDLKGNNNNNLVKEAQSSVNTKVSKTDIEQIQLITTCSINNSSKEISVNDNTHKNDNVILHTPLKISSLLNPLYCPKSKNDSNSNLAKVMPSVKTTNSENKKEEASINERIMLPNVIPVLTPNSSNINISNDYIKKSGGNLTEATKVKTGKNSFAAARAIDAENVSERKICGIPSKSGIAASANETVTNHHDRRRNLINQLEQAIAKGDEQLAAEAAAKLAKLKLACSVLSFSSQIVAQAVQNETEILQVNSSKKNYVSKESLCTAMKEKNQQTSLSVGNTSSQNDELPIELWVEDKEAARGPIPMRISRRARIGELKQHIENTLGLEIRLQRWIVGRTLCADDSTPLVTVAGPDLTAPFYLCLVESETNKDFAPQIGDTVTYAQIKTEPREINNTGEVYTELMKLEQQALIQNTEEFECGVCMEQCAVGMGGVLRECIHTFCKNCLADMIRHCQEPVVLCPATQCPGALQEREIRAILSAEEYERWLARGLAAAENGTRNTFHCRTRDCKGWAFCEPEVRRFPCPVCKHNNCVPCQAVHERESCEEYQQKLKEVATAVESNQTDEGTQALLQSLIARGEALECPECSAIITKKWGCDWVKCSACKTEICWVTKGRRWGPTGKGDTTAGCRCGVDGKRCHPSCGYCH